MKTYHQDHDLKDIIAWRDAANNTMGWAIYTCTTGWELRPINYKIAVEALALTAKVDFFGDIRNFYNPMHDPWPTFDIILIY